MAQFDSETHRGINILVAFAAACSAGFRRDAAFAKLAEPARQSQSGLPELPHGVRLEADSRRPRVRP